MHHLITYCTYLRNEIVLFGDESVFFPSHYSIGYLCSILFFFRTLLSPLDSYRLHEYIDHYHLLDLF